MIGDGTQASTVIENEDLKDFKIEELHGGYFSEDKKHNFKNTNGGTKDDEDTYRLIMSHKEKLLNL